MTNPLDHKIQRKINILWSAGGARTLAGKEQNINQSECLPDEGPTVTLSPLLNSTNSWEIASLGTSKKKLQDLRLPTPQAHFTRYDWPIR